MVGEKENKNGFVDKALMEGAGERHKNSINHHQPHYLIMVALYCDSMDGIPSNVAEEHTDGFHVKCIETVGGMSEQGLPWLPLLILEYQGVESKTIKHPDVQQSAGE